MKKSKTTYKVSVNFQKAFSAILIAMFVSQAALMLWQWADQYNQNPYSEGFEWWVIVTLGLPMAIFAFSWAFRPKQATVLAKVFDTLLVSTAASAVYTVVSLITLEVYERAITDGSGYSLFETYNLAGAAVFLTGYVIVLMYLRTTRKWN